MNPLYMLYIIKTLIRMITPKEYLGILHPVSVSDCVTKEDCDALLNRLGLKAGN